VQQDETTFFVSRHKKLNKTGFGE
jgi:hypothetical protein